MAKKQRTIVGSPLTPTLLKELGGVDKFPRTPDDFKPAGNWVNTYRIWTCHGYRENGNQNVGFLRIQKKVGAQGDTFDLRIEQTVVETDAMLSKITAQITCLNNEYASPVKWQISSRFFGPHGNSLDELCTVENVSIEGESMTIKTPTGILRRQDDRPLTSDWSLFEAAQRWVAGESRHLLATMLEGLRKLKQEQHITYRGMPQMAPKATRLFRFAQRGIGILPTEYWLDRSHRLLAVTSMNKAYILDEQAEEIIERQIEQARKSYIGRSSRGKQES
ncbi:MAG: hypothetical protein ACYSYV_01760 [Planctomycetota bacterium]|jgi:hypothetical protein